MKNVVRLVVNHKDSQKEQFGMVVENIYNGGYAGRNQEHVREHIEELAKVGVPAPTTTPTLYPLSNYNLTTTRHIQVQHGETSGEIEYCLLCQGGRIYVTVASDHTDRNLENFSVPKSKQACPNIIAEDVWLYEDVKDHWEQIQLKCWVTKDSNRSLYQDATLGALMTLEEWQPIFNRINLNLKNAAFFSGTINTVEKNLIFGDYYEIEMFDPVLNRSIKHDYTVTVLRKGIE